MGELLGSDVARSIAAELTQTAHEAGAFVQEHTLTALAIVFTAFVLWRWAATPSR